MPDHDIVDLDSSFAALERNLAGIGGAPGADRAMSAARRRRRTTEGAVAAVALLAVGALAAGQGLGGSGNAVAPAAGLPDPRPIDAASLTDATAGWTPAWENTGGGAKQQLVGGGVPTRCLTQVEGVDTPSPSGSGGLGLVAGQAVAVIGVADYGQDDAKAQSAWEAYTSGAASCAHARQSADDTTGTAQVVRYTISPPAPATDQYLWLVRVGDQMGAAWIAGATDPLPSEVGDRVTNAMLAGVQAPGSYTRSQGDTGDTGGSNGVFVDSDTFASVLGSWHSGWSATDGNPPGSLPCGVDLASAQQSTSGALGANGEEMLYGYATAADAEQQAQNATARLRGCPSYDVQQASLPGGTSLTVTAGSGAGTQVMWMLQSGPSLGVIHVPASDTAPPDEVNRGVAKLLAGSVETWTTQSAPDTGSGVATKLRAAGASATARQ